MSKSKYLKGSFVLSDSPVLTKYYFFKPDSLFKSPVVSLKDSPNFCFPKESQLSQEWQILEKGNVFLLQIFRIGDKGNPHPKKIRV